MRIARGKLGEYEATTWDELVAHGREQIGCPEGEMPGRFVYGWCPVSYEKEHGTYVITTEKGLVRFHSDDMLLASASGTVICVSVQAFNNQFKIMEDK